MNAKTVKSLSSQEVAIKLGISSKVVSELCRYGKIPGAFRKNRRWRIPVDSIKAIEQHRIKFEITLWDKARYILITNKAKSVLFLLVSVFTFIFAAISAGADLGSARQQLEEWGLLEPISPFEPAQQDEILIVVARFYRTEGVIDTDIHNEIRQAIEQAASELNLSNLRVEIENKPISAEDREKAASLGIKYNATIIIWGSDTGARITVNYLNLRKPTSPAGSVTISELQKSQIANPRGYVQFVTNDLPSKMTFLSLFTIAQSYKDQDNKLALGVLKKGFESLSTDNSEIEGIVDAHFLLGWLYWQNGEEKLSEAELNKIISLDPEYALAYHNRGLIRIGRGELSDALQDFNEVIQLAPDMIDAYLERGRIFQKFGESRNALSDLQHYLTSSEAIP